MRKYQYPSRPVAQSNNGALFALTSLPARVAGFNGLGAGDAEGEAKRMVMAFGGILVASAFVGYILSR